MARFPRTESQVIVLTEDMSAGLAENAAVYPAPPVAPADLQTTMAAYKIQYRLSPSGAWSDTGMAIESEPSNTVMAVL